MDRDTLTIAGRTFRSRLIVGTGKYVSHALMAQAHKASGTEMVTVAVRRVNMSDRSKESLLDFIDTEKYALLPNTAGCYTADDAVRTAHLGREAGLSNWVKLEVIGDEKTLFPDNEALLDATRRLVKDDFVVLPYTNDDPVVCRKLEDEGAAAVMPLGSADRVGSGHPESQRHSDHHGVCVDSGHRRCGCWDTLRYHPGDGAWRRRHSDEYGDRRRSGPRGYGDRHAVGRRGRAPGVSFGADTSKELCLGQQPDRWRRWPVATLRSRHPSQADAHTNCLNR